MAIIPAYPGFQRRDNACLGETRIVWFGFVAMPPNRSLFPASNDSVGYETAVSLNATHSARRFMSSTWEGQPVVTQTISSSPTLISTIRSRHSIGAPSRLQEYRECEASLIGSRFLAPDFRFSRSGVRMGEEEMCDHLRSGGGGECPEGRKYDSGCSAGGNSSIGSFFLHISLI